jgi:tRNA-2-methylthio-N6-dimethylallyladenosine synthase
MDLIRQVRFASAYSFKYSPRPGTPAAEMGEQVPEDVKTARLHMLQAEVDRQMVAFQDSLIGQTFDVLFEKPGRHPGQIVGRSPWLTPVAVDGPVSLIGTLAPVTITRTISHTLIGDLAIRADTLDLQPGA